MAGLLSDIVLLNPGARFVVACGRGGGGAAAGAALRAAYADFIQGCARGEEPGAREPLCQPGAVAILRPPPLALTDQAQRKAEQAAASASSPAASRPLLGPRDARLPPSALEVHLGDFTELAALAACDLVLVEVQSGVAADEGEGGDEDGNFGLAAALLGDKALVRVVDGDDGVGVGGWGALRVPGKVHAAGAALPAALGGVQLREGEGEGEGEGGVAWQPGDSPYVILGLVEPASLAQVRRAYKRLAKALHPDKVKGGEARALAKARFAAVADAYAVLTAKLAPNAGASEARDEL